MENLIVIIEGKSYTAHNIILRFEANDNKLVIGIVDMENTYMEKEIDLGIECNDKIKDYILSEYFKSTIKYNNIIDFSDIHSAIEKYINNEQNNKIK